MCGSKKDTLVARPANGAQAKTIKATVQPARPSWECVYYGYPARYDHDYFEIVQQIFDDKPLESIKEPLHGHQPREFFLKSILGQSDYKDKFNREHESAIRISIACTISKNMKSLLDKDVEKKSLKTVARVVEGLLKEKGYSFITDVKELKEWLSKKDVWGTPDRIKAPKQLDDLRKNKKMNGKKGVCIILKSGNSSEKGYATLWKNNNLMGGHDYIGTDCTIYFWDLEEIEKDYTHVLPVVIYRYKMPGLNSTGKDIADDMCYGMGDGNRNPIYSPRIIDNYKSTYKEKGFDPELHAQFSNERDLSSGLEERFDPEIFALIAERNGVRGISKARYNKNDLAQVPNFRKIDDWDQDKLFKMFRDMADSFSRFSMNKNIDQMINRFQSNEGGVYTDKILTTHIKGLPATNDYCNDVENYIKKILIDSRMIKDHELVKQLEDREVYFYEEPDVKKENILKKKTGFRRPTPMYGGIINCLLGSAIALHDIWASEISIVSYKRTGNAYHIKYKITLYDHFGLDIDDIKPERPGGMFPGFRAWFILQHIWGYKPFITKISFERDLRGTL